MPARRRRRGGGPGRGPPGGRADRRARTGRRQRIAADLRRQGVRVALGFDDWAQAAAGATVVGTRTAVWMPMPRLAAVVVLDEHSESLQSEQAPTWHARDVALERARRAGAPTVLVSPVPTLEALEAGELRTLGRVAERDGWPVVEVLDRRLEDPVRGGLFAEGLRDRLAAAGGRVAVVLNRKGRGRLSGLQGLRGVGSHLGRPCAHEARRRGAGGSRRQRAPPGGVRPVRVDGAAQPAHGRHPGPRGSCFAHRRAGGGVDGGLRRGWPSGSLWAPRRCCGAWSQLPRSVFLDFDQELLAPRQRASEQALALLARGARLWRAPSRGAAWWCRPASPTTRWCRPR